MTLVQNLDASRGWAAMPQSLAKHIGRGKWSLYPYIDLIGRIIWRAVMVGGARVVLSVPPRHGKSEFCSYSVPVWFEENWPWLNVMLATYEADFAGLWGRRVRNAFQDDSLGLKTRVSGDSSSAGRWNTTEGGGMLCAGVGGPITGRGFHLGLIDDPVKNWEEAQSPTVRQKTIDWFNSTFYTRAEPGASIIVIMTRWHERDLAGYLLSEHEDSWTEIRLPALAEAGDPMGRQEGEALCPERYSREALLKIKKAIGSFMFAALYQQRPTPEAGGIFKREWWRRYRELPNIVGTVCHWDTAVSKKDGAAYSCGQAWGWDGHGYYLIDLIRERMEYPELKAAVKDFAVKHRPTGTYVEDKSSGQQVVQDLARDTLLPILGVKVTDGDKVVRARLISPLVEAGKVYLPDSAPWVSDFLAETTAFPNSSYLDQVDCMSQALKQLRDKAFGLFGDSDLS